MFMLKWVKVLKRSKSSRKKKLLYKLEGNKYFILSL